MHYVSWNVVNSFEKAYNGWMTLKITQGHCNCHIRSASTREQFKRSLKSWLFECMYCRRRVWDTFVWRHALQICLLLLLLLFHSHTSLPLNGLYLAPFPTYVQCMQLPITCRIPSVLTECWHYKQHPTFRFTCKHTVVSTCSISPVIAISRIYKSV